MTKTLIPNHLTKQESKPLNRQISIQVIKLSEMEFFIQIFKSILTFRQTAKYTITSENSQMHADCNASEQIAVYLIP